MVLTPFAITGYRAITLPMLYDVSTDTDDPPELTIAAAHRTDGMNPIEPFTPERRKLQQDNYPTATGRRYEAPMGQVAEVVQDVLDDRGWTIVSSTNFPPDATEITIEAQASSPLLGFPADVAIRLIDEDTSTYVDMRSASRYGPHDFGDNAARIAFLPCRPRCGDRVSDCRHTGRADGAAKARRACATGHGARASRKSRPSR